MEYIINDMMSKTFFKYTRHTGDTIHLPYGRVYTKDFLGYSFHKVGSEIKFKNYVDDLYGSKGIDHHTLWLSYIKRLNEGR